MNLFLKNKISYSDYKEFQKHWIYQVQVFRKKYQKYQEINKLNTQVRLKIKELHI